MLVLIGTQNPGKIEGARLALSHYFDDFEVVGISVPSNVPDQPLNDDVVLGAENRVNNLIKYATENNIDADYYFATEAGLTNQIGGKWVNINYAFIKDKYGKTSYGISSAFPIPNSHLEKIKETSLSEVMDELFSGNKLSNNKGGISYLTKGYCRRIDLVRDAFVMALVSFVNEMWCD